MWSCDFHVIKIPKTLMRITQKKEKKQQQHLLHFCFISYFLNFFNDDKRNKIWVLFVDENPYKKVGCVYFWVCRGKKSMCCDHICMKTPHFDSVANLFQVDNVASVAAFVNADHFSLWSRIWLNWHFGRSTKHCERNIEGNVMQNNLAWAQQTQRMHRWLITIWSTNWVWGNRIMLISGPYLLMLLQRLPEWLAPASQGNQGNESQNFLQDKPIHRLNATWAMPMHSLSLSLLARDLRLCAFE